MIWKLFRSLLLAGLLLTVAGCSGDGKKSKSSGDSNVTIALTDAEAVSAVIESLGIEFNGEDSNESVTQSLTLPVEGEDNVTISWSSSDTSIIAADGTLTRPAQDTTVTLTVTIMRGDESLTKVFNVLVKAAAEDPSAAVAEDALALVLDQEITADLVLALQGANGTTITWESNKTGVIAVDGTVTPVDEDISVTLTATISKDGATETKSFIVTVKVVDTDGDGVPDSKDAFPDDATESVDSDGDGVGDNTDAFPNDATETVDSDGDGTGDSTDNDDDNDGVADSSDAFPTDPTESADSDGDGVGDNADEFPNVALTKVVVFANDYITQATVKDADGDVGTESDTVKGEYIFGNTVTYPLTVTGGYTAESNQSLDVNLTSYSDVVSPIRSVVGNDTALENMLPTLLDLASTGELDSFMEDERVDAAKFSLLSLGVLSDENTTTLDNFRTRLSNMTDNNLTQLITDVLRNDAKKVGLRVFLGDLREYDGDYANLDSGISDTLALIDYQYDLEGNKTKLVNLVAAYDGNYSADPSSDLTKALEQNLTYANTSGITDMSSLFENRADFNVSIGYWDTGSVATTNRMFYYATNFNQPVGDWNTGNVTNMQSMFERATSFNQPIGDWNTSSVTYMGSMLLHTPFNQSIGSWDTSSVTSMSKMFNANSDFNQTIADWNTSNVLVMDYMFAESNFNRDISKWDVSKVYNMSYMFRFSSFNQDIGDWNTSSAVNMGYMFYYATSFNQDLSGWDVDQVTTTTQFSTATTSWTLPQPAF